MAKALEKNIGYLLGRKEGDNDINTTITQHQQMCIEVSNNFMKINNPKQQEAVNALVRSLVEKEHKVERN